jgi:hypothetical protein
MGGRGKVVFPQPFFVFLCLFAPELIPLAIIVTAAYPIRTVRTCFKVFTSFVFVKRTSLFQVLHPPLISQASYRYHILNIGQILLLQNTFFFFVTS